MLIMTNSLGFSTEAPGGVEANTVVTRLEIDALDLWHDNPLLFQLPSGQHQ